ncbi:MULTISPECIES: transposase [Paenibacillus]|uniref:transposase n=1 Tax=Paenibacillus TaxID=44249 RepID=UPI0038738C1C
MRNENHKEGGPRTTIAQWLNAMLWMARTGALWRDLPEYYASCPTVFSRFRRWKIAGIWDQILDRS